MLKRSDPDLELAASFPHIGGYGDSGNSFRDKTRSSFVFVICTTTRLNNILSVSCMEFVFKRIAVGRFSSRYTIKQ